jgi:hypothetical protein
MPPQGFLTRHYGGRIVFPHITTDIHGMEPRVTIIDGDRVDDDTRWVLFLYATKVKGVTYLLFPIVGMSHHERQHNRASGGLAIPYCGYASGPGRCPPVS